MVWNDLSAMISGTIPAPNSNSKGFTSIGDQLFLFGGESYQGDVHVACDST
jgi:hypothetical protein